MIDDQNPEPPVPTEAGSVTGTGSTDDTAVDADEREILEDAREDVLDFLEGLLDSMDADGDVVAEITDEGNIAAVIEGADGGLLIGRRGQTLDAIQELMRTAVQHKAKTRVRATLDIEGYRDRRRQEVAGLAREAAQRAMTDGEVEMEPMSAYERKVVHDTAAAIEGVTTFSEGVEPKRRVIIKAASEGG